MDVSKVKKVVAILKKTYPGAKIALDFSNPLELLVATILSAQCTDKRVNSVTRSLFGKYRTAADYAAADAEAFEQEIRSTGFYHNKARSIIGAARMMQADFGGKVPDTMEELIRLPGVARKTANIVLFNAFNRVAGIAVDTHVRRVSRRLGFTENEDPPKIERDLMELVPKKDWGRFSYLLIDHGRSICRAKKPLCPDCPVQGLCPSSNIFYP